MPSNPKLANAARARLARLYINGATPDPEVVNAVRREIKETELANHVQACLATAPPLTAEARQRIASILTAASA